MNISSVIESVDCLRDTAVAIYFSTPTCSVCHSLKPHIAELLNNEFPNIVLHEVNIPEAPEVSAHFTVFTAPTLIIFYEGKEFRRFTRAFGISEIRQSIERPYQLLFS